MAKSNWYGVSQPSNMANFATNSYNLTSKQSCALNQVLFIQIQKQTLVTSMANVVILIPTTISGIEDSLNKTIT